MTVIHQSHALRLVVYAMLVVSAGATFWLGDRLWEAARFGELPIWLPLLAPGAFTAFVVVYSIDRWLLVRRHSYSLGRALMQLAFALIFLTLLWPHQAEQLKKARKAHGAVDPVAKLLHHPTADVRAVACEVFGWRADVAHVDRIQKLATSDSSTAVRERCAEALARLRTARAP